MSNGFSSRSSILAALRKNAPSAKPLPDVPLFDADLPERLPQFIATFERMGGKWAGAVADIETAIRVRFPDAKVVCSAVPEVAHVETWRRIDNVSDPRTLEDVDVGVVRAAFGVAETGSLFLSETEYRVNALGYLPQHLVVLLDPADIEPNLHRAYQRREFHAARYAVLMSGPSATADIEGVLIRGAQGVRSLTVIAAPKV